MKDGADLRFSEISEAASLLHEGSISPVDLLNLELQIIEDLEPKLNSFMTIMSESALRDAIFQAEQIRRQRFVGPLQGVPISVKDNIYIKNVRCTVGSKIFSDYTAEYDATSVSKVRENGAIIVGKNNLHEFASGVTNINPFFGAAKNPWNLGRITGGSSGGSAAAVSAGMVFASIGSDSSGSVRIPASLCGVVGLKPTIGRISKYGVFPLSKTLDHVGVLARSCLDVAIMLRALSGFDQKDPLSAHRPIEDYPDAIGESAPNLIVGFPKNYFMDVLSDEVRESFHNFLNSLVGMGVIIKEIEVKNTETVHKVWSTIRFAEASTLHADWMKTRRSEYGKDIIRMLDLGQKIRSEEYETAIETKSVAEQSFLDSMEGVDAIAVPTTPIVAPPLSTSKVEIGGKGYDIYSILCRLTFPFNVTGFPALTVPTGLSKEGLPIAAQLCGRPFEESVILRIGHNFERQRGRMMPPL